MVFGMKDASLHPERYIMIKADYPAKTSCIVEKKTKNPKEWYKKTPPK